MPIPHLAPATGDRRLRSVVLRTIDELHAVASEWEELLALDERATIFQSWAWVSTWFEHFVPDGSLHVVTFRDGGGRLVGVVPGAFSRGPHFPFFRYLRTLGGHQLTEYADGFAHPDFLDSVGQHLAEVWANASSRWDRLLLNNFPMGGPVAIALSVLDERGFVIQPTFSAAVRRSLPDSWQAFYTSLSKSMKDNVNNYSNRLAREGHAVNLVVVEDQAQFESGLETLFRLHHLRSAASLQPRHPDYFDTLEKRAFIRALASRLIDRSMLEIALLEVDGIAVAAQACLKYRGCLSLYYSGFDPAWARYGVMTVLSRRCLQRAIEHGSTELDLLVGPSQDKLRWGGRQVQLGTGVMHNPGFRSRLALLAERTRSPRRLLESARRAPWSARTVGG